MGLYIMVNSCCQAGFWTSLAVNTQFQPACRPRVTKSAVADRPCDALCFVSVSS